MKTFIICVVIIAVLITAGTIVVGTDTFEGVTVNNPYEKGLQWDSIRNARLQTGWAVNITNNNIRTGENDISIEITDKANKPVHGAAVTLTVSRPSAAVYDRTYNAKEQAGGVYHATVKLPVYGYWDLKSNVALNKQSAMFEENIYAEKYN